MRSSSFFIAAASLFVCSQLSRANFTVTAVLNGAPVNGRQRVDLIAFNDGVGSGSKLLDVEFHYGSPSTRAYFGLQDLLPTDGDGNPVPDGVFDTVNLYNNPSLQPLTSQLRFSSAPGASTLSNPASSEITYQGFLPTVSSVQSGSPYNGGLTSFTGAYGMLGSANAPIANGTNGGAAAGASFGRLYIDAGGSFTMSGFIAGDQGNTFPFTTGIGDVPADPHFVVVTSPPPQTITFGKDVGAGASFTAQVVANDFYRDVLNLTVGIVPPGVTITSVSGSGLGNVGFTITGTLAYSTNLTTVTIPFTVQNGVGGSYPGSIVLNVVPEPVTSGVAVAAIVAIAARVRSRRNY